MSTPIDHFPNPNIYINYKLSFTYPVNTFRYARALRPGSCISARTSRSSLLSFSTSSFLLPRTQRMLAGRVPFQADSTVALYYLIRHASYDMPDTWVQS